MIKLYLAVLLANTTPSCVSVLCVTVGCISALMKFLHILIRIHQKEASMFFPPHCVFYSCLSFSLDVVLYSMTKQPLQYNQSPLDSNQISSSSEICAKGSNIHAGITLYRQYKTSPMLTPMHQAYYSPWWTTPFKPWIMGSTAGLSFPPTWGWHKDLLLDTWVPEYISH